MKKGASAAVLVILLSVAPSVQADDPFSGWMRAETEHFLFIYEPRDQHAAVEMLTFAEQVYGEVTSFLDSYPDQIRVLIRGRIDTANGLFTAPPNHLEIHVTAPSGPWLGVQDGWLRTVFTHELTHYVHMAYERGLFAALSRVFGDSAKTGIIGFLYGWPVEGIPVATETWLTRGGRGRNRFFEMYYKAPIVEGTFPSFRQAQYSAATLPPGRHYVMGYIIVDHLTRHYGRQVITEVHRQFVRAPYLGVNRALRKVTGKNGQEIFAEMVAELESRYAGSEAIPAGIRLGSEGLSDYGRPISTDRGLYMSRRGRHSRGAIVSLDPDTGAERTLAYADLTDRDSLTADRVGRRIVFAAYRQNSSNRAGPSLTSDLYTLDLDAEGRARRLTDLAHLYHPALSPDGSRLVAVQIVGSYSRLVEVDIESGETSVLFQQENTTVYTPRFSPDGRQLVFVWNIDGIQNVWLLDWGESASPRPLIEPDHHGDFYPEFVDDDTLLFTSDRSGELALYSVETETSRLTLLARDPVGAFAGVKDQNHLYYLSYSSLTGFCIKRKSLADLEPKVLAALVSGTGPPGTVPAAPPAGLPLAQRSPGERRAIQQSPALPGPLEDSRRYIDLAWPVLWLPMISVTSGGPSRLDWGGGALLLGASVTGNAFWMAQATYLPGPGQVQADLEAARGWGPFRVGLTASEEYEYRSDVEQYRQTTLAGGDLGWVWSTAELQRVWTATVGAGMTYRHTEAALQPFGLGPGAASRDELALRTGFGGRGERIGSSWDLYPAPALSLVTELAVPAQVFPDSGSGYDVAGRFSVSVPLPIRHHVLRVGARGTYSEWGWYALPEPRGDFDLPPRPEEAQFVAAVDYLFPIALLDRPLIGSTYLLSLAAGFHLEGLAALEPGSSEGLRLGDDLFVGAETTAQLGINMFVIPVGLGLSARLDRTGQRPFEAADDLRPYFFIGYDSAATAATGRTRAEPRGARLAPGRR